MKTINLLAETIQQALLGIQQFVSAFSQLGAMANDGMINAREEALREFEAAAATSAPITKLQGSV